MSQRAHGQIRRGQVITTYGPGALIDLPQHSAIVGGLETWPRISDLHEIVEPRLTQKLQLMTQIKAPRLYAPPAATNDPREKTTGIGVWRFPEWCLVQEPRRSDARERSRRLVHRKALDGRGRFDGDGVIATRFVRACPRGHVDDLDCATSCTAGASAAGGSSGSTSAGRAEISPTSSHAVSAAGRAECTRPP